MGMACLQYKKHFDTKISRCPHCGARLKAPGPELVLAPAWPHPDYGTFPGFFTSPWPKTDEEHWEQTLREQPAPDESRPPSPSPFPAPEALPHKSPQLRMNRHTIEPLAR